MIIVWVGVDCLTWTDPFDEDDDAELDSELDETVTFCSGFSGTTVLVSLIGWIGVAVVVLIVFVSTGITFGVTIFKLK